MHLNKKKSYAPYIFGAAVFVLSCIYLNFNGTQLYNWDMYTDAYVAKLMAEGKCLFPESWVFGNQYYICATPNIAALIYCLCGNMTASMAVASSIMMLLILTCFAWCIWPFCSKKSIAVGLFSLSGAVILGYSAGSCTCGLQLFYTMASYYACYVVGILLTLGVFLRMRECLPCGILPVILALAMSVALGMQSVRELLVLYLPLLALELLLLLQRRFNKKRTLFTLGCLGANFLGIAAIKLCNVKSSPNISQLALCGSFDELKQNLFDSTYAIKNLIGLNYIDLSWKWKPLFLLSLFICAVVLCAAIIAVHKKDRSPLAETILFSAVSVLAVFAVGLLLFRTRDIYYFVWYLLAAFCFTYFAEKAPDGWLKKTVLVLLLLCGAANYFYNFYPDIKKSTVARPLYYDLAEELVQEGTENIYIDLVTAPTIAACSEGRITAACVEYKGSGDDIVLQAVRHLKDERLYQNIDTSKAVFIMSDPNYEAYASDEYLKMFFSEKSIDELMSKLELIRTVDAGDTILYIYRILDDNLISG